VFATAILIASTVVGCGSADKPEAAAPTPEKPHKLHMVFEKVGPRRVAINVTTDLPDGTNLFIKVHRSYWHKTDRVDEEFAGEIFSKDLPVVGGKITAHVDIDDSKWLKERESKKAQFTAAGIWDEVGKISPDVTAWVLYSPKRPQPPSIQKLLGAVPTMEVEKSLPVPFRR
jgi:hypothetical protein